MKKLLNCLIVSFLLAGVVFAQSGRNTVVGVLKGPSGIPMANMMESYQADYEVYAAANQLLPKLLKGEVDIGFLPPNVAAKAYNSSKGKVVIAGVCGNGMLNLVTKDAAVKSLKDLKGKTVSVAGQGATPEYVTRFLLEYYGIADSVQLDFSIPNADIAPALIADKIEYAIVPEPFSTVAVSKDSRIMRAIDIQEEWALVTGQKSYPMTVIVVNAQYAKDYAKSVKSFVSSYQKAVKWTVANPVEAGKLVEKYDLGLTSAVVAKAVPNCAFTYNSAKKSRKDIEELLNVFVKADPTSIGGQLPDDMFYFN